MKDNLVYITQANSKRIINSIKKEGLELKGQIYKRPIYFFNKYETKSLQLLKEFFMNPEKFFNDYYKNTSHWDSLKYIFEEQAPAFHFNKDCEKLNNDFVNYLIPEEIHKRGDEEVTIFRNWCKAHCYLIEENKKDIFMERCRLAFRLIIAPQIVEYNNSGITSFHNLTLIQIELMIDNILAEASKFYYCNEKTNTILRRFSKVTYFGKRSDLNFINNNGYTNDEVKKVLLEYDIKFKQPVFKLLREWYRVTYNKNVALHSSILKSIGFKACSTCKN